MTNDHHSRDGRTATYALRAYRVPLIVSVVLLAVIFGFSPNFRWASGPDVTPYGGDFLHEWLGGYVARTGDRQRFYDPRYVQSIQHDPDIVGFEWDKSKYLSLVYPPFYYLMVSPFSLLPVAVGAWIWAGLMIGCLVATVWLLDRYCVVRFGQSMPWLLPASLLFLPIIENFTTSQKGTLCLLLLTATFLLCDTKQPFWAGVVFGLLAFKPQLTLVIGLAMLWKRQWRFVFGGALTGAILASLCLLLGWDVCQQYVRFSMEASTYMQTAGYDLHKSHCLDGFFALLSGHESPLAARAATLIAAGIVLVLLARLVRGRPESGTPQFATQFSGLVLATLMLSPHLFTYDLTLLLLPVCLMGMQVARRMLDPGAPRAGIKWLLILLYSLSGASSLVASRIGVQVSVLLMFALLVLLVRLRSGKRGTGSEECRVKDAVVGVG